ncbi:uncharacterized protein BYT42DRAFT_557996 [Radiomyces spectabilis]|uniref:uncharacterized protein n=1 Tax=Radiomyces spectabilis TaxID=64574 RepID=UPI0022205B89|nr:uncharacterized protein BYT42DRAFT_557996 [Radiomyces spectabilis]KAI8391760.1 hypothetical protein BYT42DRAFT_557996 [Radiomyces spectabilis]
MARGTKSKTTAQQAAQQDDSVRRSHRARTVPELFMNQKYSSALSKRQQQLQETNQSDDDEERDELDSSASEDSSSSSDESENDMQNDTGKQGHAQRKRRTSKSTGRKKNVAKKRNAAMMFATESQLLEQVNVDEEMTSLYEQVSSSGANMDDIVSTWVTEYKAHKLDALRTLINFLIRSSGCMMAVREEAFSKEDIAVEALQELQEELTKLPNPEYPIISKSKSSQLLKRNLIIFFQTLIDQCQFDIIYDGTLIETLQSWLTTMSSSTYRPFRHTATIVALKLITSLSIIADKTGDELAIVSRQLTTESRKTGRARNTQKHTLLNQRSSALQRKRKDLKEYLDDFSESIFVHRARDIESVIRMECIRELCNWIQQYPSHFLDNVYLRYFGWAFNDQSASVRAESVKCATKLYKLEDVAAKLGEFTDRFKSRIEEIALYDIDVSVRVAAVGLCNVMFASKPSILSDDTRKAFSDLIVSNSARIRKTVAPFVKAMIENDILKPKIADTRDALASAANEPHSEDARRTRTRKPAVSANIQVNNNWVAWKSMASFLVDRVKKTNLFDCNGEIMTSSTSSEWNIAVQETSTLISNTIEALWGHVQVIQDYQSISDYLCRDHSNTHQHNEASISESTIASCYQLTSDEETVLVIAYVICLRNLIQRGTEKGTGATKEKKKDDGQLETLRNDMSRHLVQVLPTLLKKHSDDAIKMMHLVTVPQLMNLNVYVELRMEESYKELLQGLIKIYGGGTLPDLLLNCAQSLQHMFDTVGLAEINEACLPELLEKVMNQVRDACREKDFFTARFTSEDLHAISTSILRLDYLTNVMDITEAMDESEDMHSDVTELVGGLVDRATLGFKNEEQISCSAMAILFRYVAWKCQQIQADPQLEDRGKIAAAKLQKRRDWILEKFNELVTASEVSPKPGVRCHAFGTLVDLYWLFSSDLFSTTFVLQNLQVSCPVNVYEQSTKYVAAQLKGWINQTAEEGLADQEGLSILLVGFARAIMLGVFDVAGAHILLRHFGQLGSELDTIVKTLLSELKEDLNRDESTATKICKMFLVSLKESFEAQVDQSPRSIDQVLKLARLQARMIKQVNESDPVRQVPPHAVCDQLHLEGINYAVTKAAEHQQQDNEIAKAISLRFFKVLSVFGNQLTRARDVANIHKYLEDRLQEKGLEPNQADKEWDGYLAYIKSIDALLKKKGLRYDATRRTETVATPAAMELEETIRGAEVGEDGQEDETDVRDLAIREISKRALAETDMDTDEDTVNKRRR